MTDDTGKKILSTLQDGLETEAEILNNIADIKGHPYARRMLAMVDLVSVLYKSNAVACGEVPKEIREMIVQEQSATVRDIINAIFQLDASKDHHSICQEFEKTMMMLSKRRQAIETAAIEQIKKASNFGDESND